ncbi:hypothetical protein MSAN_02493900 [Mycena sanguinolenta]|uniref:Uncharacterized protein n=1 Tax=Mycena sanguinolenta TaxID=230812 RepID=A0A8H6TWR1_9AGAR|nr:hypothetical protein MSAN_02493900 [Mycena sanguinolenta]
MPSTRKHFVPGPKAVFKGIFTRLYSTKRATPTRDATPLVESLFQNHKAQTYIHDFHVTLHHGAHEDHYQVYLKRGVVLAANRWAHTLKGDIVFMRLDPHNLDRVLNMRRTAKANAPRDKPIVDYLFGRLRPFIRKFQKSGHLPKKGPVFRRHHAFY